MPVRKQAKNRAVFLDRDGVVNRVILRDGKPCAPASLAEFEFLPKVGEAIASLKAKGFKVILATNQPDVGARKQDRAAVEAIHAHIARTLAVDDIKVCYHTEKDGCACRKPKPGMLLEAAGEWHLDLKNSFMIGDRWRDIEAGRAAGCKTVWIEAHYEERQVQDPDAICASLFEASRLILSGFSKTRKNKK